MAFTVQNILKYPVNFLGNIILPEGKLDLLTLYSVDEVKTMLLYGELYNYIMGRSLTIVNPNADVYQLGLTYEQHSIINNAGFAKGYTGAEILKDAFTFTADGYLKVDLQDPNINVTATVDPTGLATAGNQVLLYNLQNDAYSVEKAINAKLDLLATSAKQDLLYTKTADAYSVENVINTKLDLLATKAYQLDAYNRAGEALTTLNSILVQDTAINAKLPASLGQKTASASFPVVLASDAYVSITGYDLASNSVYISSTYLDNDVYLEEDSAVATTALTAGTIYYYPATDGVAMGSYRNLSIHYNLVNGTDGYSEIWFEGSNRATFIAPFINITKSAGQVSSGSLYASTSAKSSVGNGLSQNDIALFQEPNLVRIRLAVKFYTANSGSVIVSFRRSS